MTVIFEGSQSLAKLMQDFNEEQVAEIRLRFEKAGCSVTSIGPQTFQIVSKIFPVLTRVQVNPFFYQFETIIVAQPLTTLTSDLTKLYEYLNEANFRAKSIKLYIDPAAPSWNKGEYHIVALFRPLTGKIGCDFDVPAVENLLMLWHQDIVELVRSTSPFSFRAMMVDPSQVMAD